jgi:hypothetical protein
VIAAVAMTKVELGQILDTISKEADSTGIFIYVIVTAVLLLLFFLFQVILNLSVVAASVLIFFLFVNFLILGLAIFLIYKMIKSGKGVSAAGALGGLAKPKELETADMLKEKKYIMMCVIAFCIYGTSLAAEEFLGKMALDKDAPAPLLLAMQHMWFADLISRFIGGCLGYFLIEGLGIWFFIVIFSILTFVGQIAGLVVFAMDAGKSGAIIPAYVLIGLGSGAIWSLIPMDIIQTGKYKAFG